MKTIRMNLNVGMVDVKFRTDDLSIFKVTNMEGVVIELDDYDYQIALERICDYM